MKNIENIFNDIIKQSNSWNTLKDNIDKNNQISGKLFELFTKYYFKFNPVIKDDYKNVWLFNEIPNEVKNKLNVGNIEYGVDLLLKDNDGKYSTVQCKYRSDQNVKLSWSKDKISNLFAFIPNADSFILFSNASEVDDVSKSRYESFIFFSIHDLLELKEFFLKIIKSYLETNKITEVEKVKPKEHQLIAIEKAVDYYKNNDRGQLILPCGAGKTFTALWIKEALNAVNTIVLLPSLALLKQFKNQWAEQKS